MTEALDLAWTVTETPPHLRLSALSPRVPPLEDLLALGGDERIAVSGVDGANKYGCSPRPAPEVAAFGSSTASTISETAFLAAERLRTRLSGFFDPAARIRAYRLELDRLRRELAALCGVQRLPGLDILLAPSGTDLHLIASELLETDTPLTSIGLEPAETGGGVGAALAGRHFSPRTALGDQVSPGDVIGDDGDGREVLAIRCREEDGALRDEVHIEADLAAATAYAVGAGRRVLLVVTDVSKTGLLAPRPGAALRMRQRWPDSVEVLVDACQFRLTPASLRAYLEAGCMVAVTGSKFLTGPSFSGALFVPEVLAERLRRRGPSSRLQSYCARTDLPAHWAASSGLHDVDNCGMLVRWEAALSELRAFRAVGDFSTATILTAFARAVQARLAEDSAFDPLPIRVPDRRALIEGSGWDEIPTIFPFLLRTGKDRQTLLNREQTEQVYRRLRAGGLQLGQPVACGERDGAPVSALRLCASARLVVEAYRGGPNGTDRMIARAMAALDKAAAKAARVKV